MGKRLTPEEREARIKAYEEAKAERQATRLERRKARIEAYEKRKEIRKKGIKPIDLPESSKNGQVKRFPAYPGEVQVGDELGFRFLGMAMSGTLIKIDKTRNYRIKEDDSEDLEEGVGFITHYVIREKGDGTFYPITKNDILAKKVNDTWIDKYNYKTVK